MYIRHTESGFPSLFQRRKFLCSADRSKVCYHRNKEESHSTGIKLHRKDGTVSDSDEEQSEFCTVYKLRQ